MKSSGFYEYIYHDLMGEIPGITSRRMFGGWGFYMDGVIFGMIIDEILYFKVGDNNRSDYIDKGMSVFTYAGKNGKTIALPYWEVPEEVMEDRSEFKDWVDKAAESGKAFKK